MKSLAEPLCNIQARTMKSSAEPLCNIQVIMSHMMGIVGGQFYVTADQRFVGVYLFETGCGTFTCCLLDGNHVYFDAEKVKVMGMNNRYYPESDGGDCWVGDHISRQPKTFYVVDSQTHERAVDDCKSWKQAKKEAERLNQEIAGVW